MEVSGRCSHLCGESGSHSDTWFTARWEEETLGKDIRTKAYSTLNNEVNSTFLYDQFLVQFYFQDHAIAQSCNIQFASTEVKIEGQYFPWNFKQNNGNRSQVLSFVGVIFGFVAVCILYLLLCIFFFFIKQNLYLRPNSKLYLVIARQSRQDLGLGFKVFLGVGKE